MRRLLLLNKYYIELEKLYDLMFLTGTIIFRTERNIYCPKTSFKNIKCIKN